MSIHRISLTNRIIPTLFLISLILFLASFNIDSCFVRIYTSDTFNRNNLVQIKYALINYHSIYKKYPGESFFNEKSTRLSWRVQLLPFLEEESIYSHFLLYENNQNVTSQLQMTPSYYKTHENSKLNTTPSFLMIPKSDLSQLPTIVAVKRADFYWFLNEDVFVLELIDNLDSNKKLYEITNDKISFCDSTDTSLLVLAPDGDIYFLPVTTTVDIFKKIIDPQQIKMLDKKKRGKLTYFTDRVLVQPISSDLKTLGSESDSGKNGLKIERENQEPIDDQPEKR